MHNKYCKNCNNLVGIWNNIYEWHEILCDFTKSKNNEVIDFLDCKNCDKFVGILCSYVCKNCFGENLIFGEENLFKWFLKYKKTLSKYRNSKYYCKICNNKYKFRYQFWFFEELTFYK